MYKYENNKNIIGQEPAQILNKRNTDRDFGLSILDSIAFFKKYNLGLKVFNIYYKLIYEYKPDIYNHNVFPRTLYLLVYNNHCWKINNDIEILAHQNIILDQKIVKTKHTDEQIIL